MCGKKNDIFINDFEPLRRLADWQVSTKNDSLVSQWEREKREQKEREERTWCPQIALRIDLFGKEVRG